LHSTATVEVGYESAEGSRGNCYHAFRYVKTELSLWDHDLAEAMEVEEEVSKLLEVSIPKDV
jgi:hypothetical protein